MQAHERRMIRRRGDDDGTGAILGTQDALDEFLHLAAALADESDDDHIRARVASHHPKEDALADAATGEESDTLPATYGQQGVDGTDTDIERLADGMSGKRVDGPPGQARGRAARERAESIERLRGSIDDAPEKLRPHADGSGALSGNHSRVGSETMRIARGHEIEPVAGKPDHLGGRQRAIAGNHIAVVTDRSLASCRLE